MDEAQDKQLDKALEGMVENTPVKRAVIELKRDEKGRVLPGQPSFNPAGRPKGKTIKERVQEWLETHDDDMAAFVEHFVKKNRDLAWQMLEGRPSQGIGQAADLDKLVINVMKYDDNNGTVPVSSEAVPAGPAEGDAAVQDSGIPQTSGEVQDSSEPTGAEITAE